MIFFILSLLIVSSIESNAYQCTRQPLLSSKSTSPTALFSSVVEDNLVAAVQKSDKDVIKFKFEPIFKSFATNDFFLHHVWQKVPYHVSEGLSSVKGLYTMEDVKNSVNSEFLEAGRGTFQEGRSGWNMAAVSKPRGTSFQDAKLQFADVQLGLKEASGTVVFNSAGGFIPELAEICLSAVNVFKFPCAINMYITNPGQKVSAPPHTDKQDVFVMQTQGMKRWRVFAPPPPSRMPRADPFARGKSKDILELAELTAPLIDVVLHPGQILYVPAGFPHTTDTMCLGNEEELAGNEPEPSLHLTVGIDTHIWGLNYASLREKSFKRSGLSGADSVLTKLEESLYWDLQSTCSLGFLADQYSTSSDSDSSILNSSGLSDDLISGKIKADSARIVDRLVSLVQKAEPNRWPTATSQELAGIIVANQAVARHIRHHREITDIFRKMYSDVAYQTTPTKMNLSIFRSQPYFQEIEKVMEILTEWAISDKGSTSDKGKEGKGKGGKNTGEKKGGFGK